MEVIMGVRSIDEWTWDDFMVDMSLKAIEGYAFQEPLCTSAIHIPSQNTHTIIKFWGQTVDMQQGAILFLIIWG